MKLVLDIDQIRLITISFNPLFLLVNWLLSIWYIHVWRLNKSFIKIYLADSALQMNIVLRTLNSCFKMTLDIWNLSWLKYLHFTFVIFGKNYWISIGINKVYLLNSLMVNFSIASIEVNKSYPWSTYFIMITGICMINAISRNFGYSYGVHFSGFDLSLEGIRNLLPEGIYVEMWQKRLLTFPLHGDNYRKGAS